MDSDDSGICDACDIRMGEMMGKLYRFFTDYRNLFIFYLVGILYVICPLQAYGNSEIQSVFQYAYIMWTVFLLTDRLLRRRYRFDSMTLAMAAFFVWCCVSFLLQPKAHGIIPLKHLFALLMFMALFFPMRRYYSDEEMKRFLVIAFKMVVYLTVILNVLSIAYYYLRGVVPFPQFFIEKFNAFDERNGVSRFSGIYFHAVLAGEKCFLTIVFSYLLYRMKKLSLPLLVLSWVSSLVMIYLGDPRTTFVQLLFVAGCVIYSLIEKAKGKNTANWCVAAVAALAIAAVGCRLARAGGVTFDVLNRLSSNRMIIWKTAITEAMKRPIFGWGWENGDSIVMFTNDYIENCHNLFVNLFLWTGIPGVILFLIITVKWASVVFREWKGLKETNGHWLAIITIALFIQSMLDILIIGEDIRVGTPFFWLLAGVTYYSAVKCREARAALSVNKEAAAVNSDAVSSTKSTAQGRPVSNKMIWTFEVFRIYFLICVFFSHLSFLIEPVGDRISTIMNFGSGAVYYFFILSAFFLYCSLQKHKPEGQKEALKLIGKRTMRYLVIYWIYLLITLIYHLILYYYSHIYVYSISDFLTTFVMNLLMVDVYVPLASPDVGWYFRSLIFCYIAAYPIYCLVNRLSGKKRMGVIFVIFVIHFIVSHFCAGTQYETWKIYYNPYLHIFDFFIGMSIAREYCRRKEQPLEPPTVKATLLEAGAIALVVIAQFVMPYHIQSLMPYRHSIYLVIMSVLVAIFSRQAGYLSIRGGSHPILSWLHKHFFSLYIFHVIMIKYVQMVPWSISKYTSLAAAVAAIIILDELVFLPLADRISKWLNRHIR